MTGKERLSITLFYSRLKKTGFEVAFVVKIGLRRNGVMVIEGRMPGQLLSTETSESPTACSWEDLCVTT